MAVRIEPHAEPIPGYTLIERLGGGGFGEVWKAEAPGGLHKAIKFVYGDLAGAGDDGHRAEQELKAMRRVQTVRHPYILSLERYDIIDGQLLIVMELADRNLWDRYRQCRSQGMPGIPFDELIRYLEETAEALDLMNGEYQLQHLDIKPQNLFLVHNHVKVADFGLVKDLEGMVASVTGGVTPVYAAPETFDGYVSRFSDQYSLAIVYQELLTGCRPFQGGNVRQLILQHLQADPDVGVLPPAQQPIIRRALSKKPDDRYPTCGEMVAALRQALRPVTPAPSWPPAVSPSAKKAGEGSAPPTVGDVPSPNGRKQRPAEVPPTTPGPSRTDPTTGEAAEEALDLAPDAPAGEVTPSQTHCFRAEPEATFPTDGTSPEPKPAAREEARGDGTLFPALVIGLGQTGLAALQQFRAQAQVSHGGVGKRAPFLDRLPHLRTLVIDTDPEVVRLASQGEGALPPSDVLLTPLNRPNYYLKPSSSKGAPSLESWLNPRMLYRIPRSQVTTGVRALGRLAFFDHYRSLARRLRDELEACLEPEALHLAAEQSGLGMRTNRPRVYLVTSLAGGTGSGMFLDVAYTLRALLKRAGFEEPDIVALLMLPPVGPRTPAAVLGNAYAALKELLHYADPLVSFRAHYHEKEAPIADREPPFSRCFVLPLGDEGDEAASRQALARVGEFLCRDLFTPLGRAIERVRDEYPMPPRATRGRYCQTFNLYPITWPRAPLVEAVCRRLCAKLVEGWASKQTTTLVEPVREWIQKKWAEKDLAADRFLERLQEGLEEILGQRPESYLETCLRAMTRPDEADSEVAVNAAVDARRKPDGTVTPERGLSSLFLFRARGREPHPPGHTEANAVKDALAELTRLLGRTTEDGLADIHGEWNERLGDVSRKLTERWIEMLSGLAVRLIEEPGFRLAGAEEGLRQMIALIEQTLQTYEPMAKEMRERTGGLFARLHEGIAAARSPDRPPPPGTLEKLLRAYGKARYQCMVMHQAVAGFLAMRGHLSDELREINYCRARLHELQRRFLEKAEPDKASAGPALGRQLFAEGAADLQQAAEQQMGILRPEDMFELDKRMERMLRKRFRALAQVCTSNVNNLPAVERAMLETAQKFVGERLPEADVAQMFFERYPDQDQLEEEILTCVEQAEPFRRGLAACLSSSDDTRRVDLCLLTSPPGPAGEQFAHLANPFLANSEVHFFPHDRDLVIHRERLNLKLTDLEQFGPLARKAYVQMNATEHFTPHTRIDEAWPDLESQASG